MIREVDQDFLLAAGIEPYDPELYAELLRERARTRFLRAVAVLQFVAIVAGIVWTST